MRHTRMRFCFFAALLACSFASLALAEDPYIHAPTPPYCSLRGGTQLCGIETVPEAQITHEIRVLEKGDIAHLQILSPIKVVERRILFLGRSKLTLFGLEDGPPLRATIEIETKHELTERRARRIWRHYRCELDLPELMSVHVARVDAANPNWLPDDSCSFYPEEFKNGWELSCDAQ